MQRSRPSASRNRIPCGPVTPISCAESLILLVSRRIPCRPSQRRCLAIQVGWAAAAPGLERKTTMLELAFQRGAFAFALAGQSLDRAATSADGDAPAGERWPPLQHHKLGGPPKLVAGRTPRLISNRSLP